jgi:serine palmitoyltransferase
MCAGYMYSNGISPPACQQVISSLTLILGEDGTDLGKRKIQQLKENGNYFRTKLIEMGMHVLGQADSPIVPIMLLSPTKVASFSRECLKRGVCA